MQRLAPAALVGHQRPAIIELLQLRAQIYYPAKPVLAQIPFQPPIPNPLIARIVVQKMARNPLPRSCAFLHSQIKTPLRRVAQTAPSPSAAALSTHRHSSPNPPSFDHHSSLSSRG